MAAAGRGAVRVGSGDFLYNLLTDVFGMANPFPSVSDVLYLAMYPLVAGGLLGFIRSRTGRNDRDSLLDATTLTIGLALLAWIFLIDPYVRSTELTIVQSSSPSRTPSATCSPWRCSRG